MKKSVSFREFSFGSLRTFARLFHCERQRGNHAFLEKSKRGNWGTKSTKKSQGEEKNGRTLRVVVKEKTQKAERKVGSVDQGKTEGRNVIGRGTPTRSSKGKYHEWKGT